MPGQLWVIEGGDGVGKATQTKLLAERLHSAGQTVSHYDIPQYQRAPFGPLIRAYLDGELGDPEQLGVYFVSLLYAADRGTLAKELAEKLNRGEWILCDRYISSNLAYSGARIADVTKRERFQSWVETLEYTYFGLPPATQVVLLNLPVATAQTLTKTRLSQTASEGGKISAKDINEQNLPYLEQVHAEYRRLAEKYNWAIINCAPEGQLLSKETIHDQIWQMVEAHLTK